MTTFTLTKRSSGESREGQMPGLSDSARRALGSGAARSRSPPRPAAGQDVETFFNAFLSGYLLGRYGGSADAARRLWRIMVRLRALTQ